MGNLNCLRYTKIYIDKNTLGGYNKREVVNATEINLIINVKKTQRLVLFGFLRVLIKIFLRLSILKSAHII